MIENVTEVTKETLIDEVQKIKNDGYRFVTASCVDMGEQFMIYYHFDRENIMQHLKLLIKKDEELPSLSKVYLAGALVENEIKDFFGIKVSDLAIDYGGKFLITGDVKEAPMLNYIEQKGEK